MKPSIRFAALLMVTVCAAVTVPQRASSQAAAPVAYVYVLNRVTFPGGELDGFSADSTGALTPLPGSPFWTSSVVSLSAIAHTAHWLFASDGVNIYSFSIASNGALTLKSSINAQQFSPSGSDALTGLVLDRTWSTLYAREYDSSSGGNTILAFNKNSMKGTLSYLGSTDYPAQPITSRITFIGNNQYVYSGAWFAAQRSSDGTLSSFSINPPLPSSPTGDYSPSGAAADPSNNLAVSFFIFQSDQSVSYALAAYTADSFGNLTTNNTTATTSSTYPARMSVSPAGNLLAVGGPNGLQVFHFNGSNPITAYTKRLAWTNNDLAWDTHNHLYAAEKGGVHVWRITPNFWKQASPYPLSNPVALTVVSK